MNAARSATRLFALASIAATVALTVTETPCQVVPSWVTILDDAGRFDTAKLVALDPAGNIIVAGVSGPGYDLRLAKIDPSGTVIWSNRYPLPPDAGLKDVGLTVDGAGNILTVCNQVGVRAVTVKVSGAGTELWRVIYDTPGSDTPAGIVQDAAGRSFVGGWTSLQEPTRKLVNAFIVSYDANGSLLWEDRYDNKNDHERISAIARHPVGGAVYLAGSVYTQLGAGAQSPVLLRYDPDGRLRWAKRYQEKPNTHGRPLGFAQKVAVGPDGNVALAGFLATGGVDIQVIKVDASSGKDLWSAVSAEATYDGAATYDELIDLAFDGSGNILVAGSASSQPEELPAFLNGLLLRYAPNGVLTWAVSDDRIDVVPGALAVDASGSATVASARYDRVGDTLFLTRIWLTTGYDAAGQQVWTAEYDGNPGGVANGFPRALALTSAGDVIVVGDVNGDIHVVSYRQP